MTRHDPPPVALLLRKAAALAGQGRPDQAAAACRAVLAMDPDHDQAARLLIQLLLAGAQIRTGKGGAPAPARAPAVAVQAEQAAVAGQAGTGPLKAQVGEAVVAASGRDIAVAGDAEEAAGAAQAREAGFLAACLVDRTPDDAEACLLLGEARRAEGRREEALAALERAWRLAPDLLDAAEGVADLLRDMGRFEEAANAYRRLLEREPDRPGVWGRLGAALQEAGRLAEAGAAYERALAQEPSSTLLLNNLAVARRRLGDPAQAVRLLERALALEPDSLPSLVNLIQALVELGQPDEALRRGQAVLSERPASAALLNGLAVALLALRRPAEAEQALRRSLALEPDNQNALLNLGKVLFESRRHEEAKTLFDRAAGLAPRAPEPWIGLSAACAAVNDTDNAVSAGRTAWAKGPGRLDAGLARCMAHLRILYDHPDQIEEARENYRRDLTELAETVRLDSPGAIAQAARVLGNLCPFYLAYHNRPDAGLQRIYGELAVRVARAAWPEFAELDRAPGGDGPLRVGVVSAFFHTHSNWKIPIRGWLENLDRDRFELFGYHVGGARDAVTDQARAMCRGFVEGVFDVGALARLIRRDRPHVLIFPEIGMHPLTLRLAALRLAPAQCSSWGHPETSGLPTMDYFLSSDLMEPANGQDHYTERLVRLPDLSIHYLPPDVRPARLGRADFGLPEGEVLYLCAQSLFKYLPQYDDLYPRIAEAVGRCRFVFIASQSSPRLTERFVARLRGAFARRGLDPDRHLIMAPQQPLDRYHALNRCCDLFLDSVGWSGCNSALEALACDLPVITWPGDLMRGRHALAILEMMREKSGGAAGTPDAVAASFEDYVRLAADLGRDPERRADLQARQMAGRQLLYADARCVRALEDCLEAAVRQA